MAEALVSTLLEQLVSTMYQEIQQEVRQVVGVRKQVDKITSTLQVIRAALIDAEERQVKEEVVKDWIEKLRDVCYDIDDVLDDWSTAILKSQIGGVENDRIPKKKVCSYIYSPCFCFSQVGVRHDIACKIKELNDRLDAIDCEKNRYHFKSITSTKEPERLKTTSFTDESEVYGRDDAKESIVSQLLCESSREKKSLHIISIVGMGGIGKTTLAQLAYNDGAVKDHFDKRIWVCVSDPFDEIRIAKAIAEGLDVSNSNSLGWEILLQRIHEFIEGKKFLLVLDDLWTDDFQKWEPFKHSLRNGAQGSRILVTTRNERVAMMMGTTYTCPLGVLSNEVCWSIFSQMAFSERSMEDRKKLEEIGKEIANRCKGLPLAAKTLGSLMRFKKSKEEWKNVLDSKIWELEEAEIGIFPHLFLSYNDLPSALKRCFSYCAIFPKDYKIEVNDLILRWMAQGYLNSRRTGIEMEENGREHFENLALRSFFQDFEEDEYSGRIERCKMHDIVHDFAQFLTKKECFHMGVDGAREPSVDSSCGKTRHLTVELAAKGRLPLSIYSRKNLRTLFVANNSGRSIIQPDLFHHLKCLRALDLRNMYIEELPREVENLIHLRYLNLSDNYFKELPETVCNLCNLQTLNLDSCWELEELPKGMGKLINLRHLQISWRLRSLPKGIVRLSSLQTLSKFIISGSHEREGCKLGDLKDLNSLRGGLFVRKLGNVEDASEAEKADLKRKQLLRHLELDFRCEDGAEVAGEKMCEVIEALQPHSNLERLFIGYYRGSVFPNWMMLSPNLKKIHLEACRNCVCLPPLGKLPSLESLGIYNMDSVKKVGIEFLGIGIDASLIIAFPMLKHLSFWNMKEWEEWDVMITKRREEDKIMIMPSLRSLTIEDCPKLKALPHHLQTMPLEYLEITECPILKARCQKEIGEDWANISHIPNIIIKASRYS